MAARWTLVVGFILLAGCGGRSRNDGLVQSSAGAATAGASNDEPAAGGTHGGSAGSAGAGALGGGSSINAIDDESPPSGAPVAPTSAAIFWRAPGGGWKIGNWFLFSDSVHDVGLSPIEPARDGSIQGRHVSGSDFPFGVVLWLELDHPQRHVVDLSGYAGLTFWARLSSSDGNLDVLLNDGSTGPAAWTESPPGPSVAVAIGPGWQEVTLPFEVFGDSEPKAVSIDFHVGSGGESFDLWIDDLAFFCRGPCP